MSLFSRFRPMQVRLSALVIGLGLIASLSTIGTARFAHAATLQCFPTHFCVADPFLTYWQTHGGLAIYGYPISDLHHEVDPQTGTVVLVQWFERNRFEYHPENAAPYTVELGLLGNQVTAGRHSDVPFQPIAAFTDTSVRRYFGATGHSLGNGFKGYWDAHGGLAQFGYPTSEEFSESTAQGSFTVQYFERARFEFHPTAPPAYQVLLGLLGDQLQGTFSNAITITAATDTPVGTVSATIPDYGTAQLPEVKGGGATTVATVTVHFPDSVTGQAFTTQIMNPATALWQIGPATVSGTTYSIQLTGKSNSGGYIMLGITHGAGAPLVWFGVQFGEAQTAPLPLYDNRTDPAQLIIGYYNAINRHEYDRAYATWATPGTSATSTPPDYPDFRAGYATTGRVDVLEGTEHRQGTAGSIYVAIPVVLTVSGTEPTTRYYGCYTLRQSTVATGNSLPPYPFQLIAAHIEVAPAGDTSATLLNKAVC